MKYIKTLVLLLLTESAQGRTSRRTKNSKGSKETKVLSACMDTYPGYTGNIDASQSKITVTFEDEIMALKYNLKGVEENCIDCGIHIHAGTSCDDADLVEGHYWDAAKTENLWTTAGGAVYNSDAGGNAKDHFHLTNGYDVDENNGHAVVIHAQDGSRVACGVLSKSRKSSKSCKSKKMTLETCIDVYPDYAGDLHHVAGKVKVDFKGTDMSFKYNMKNADVDCKDCAIHIHTGTTCDVAAEVGGHYWSNVDGMTPDPWTAEFGAFYESDSNGKAKDHFHLNAGLNYYANDGHAVVVHDKHHNRYGCGVLSSKKKAKGSCLGME